MPTAIWKVGGSLFDLPDLRARLQNLIDSFDDRKIVVVPGGGDTANLVREWQERHGLSEESAHWLAIRAMDFNAHRLATLFRLGVVVYERADAEKCWRQGEQPVCTLVDFTEHQEYLARLGMAPYPSSIPLKSPASSPEHFTRLGMTPHCRPPHNWSVTSDSLSAELTIDWRADELVLLKSLSLEPGVDAICAAERGLVDEHFPQVAPRVPRIRWCDLRAERPVIQDWLTDGAPVSA